MGLVDSQTEIEGQALLVASELQEPAHGVEKAKLVLALPPGQANAGLFVHLDRFYAFQNGVSVTLWPALGALDPGGDPSSSSFEIYVHSPIMPRLRRG